MDGFNSTRCFFWTPGQLRIGLYHSSSFFYVSKLVVALNALTSPVSAFGNGLVFVALVLTRSLHEPAYILIASLALADCLVGALVQPLMIAAMNVDDFSQNCLFVDSFTYLATALGSISGTTMAAVSCERFLALFIHLRYAELVTNRRAIAVALALWAGWFVLVSFTFGEDTPLPTILLVLKHVIYFVLLVVVPFCYVKIFLLVRRHRRQIQAQLTAINRSSRKSAAEQFKQTKLTELMCYVLGVSLLCYFPASVVTVIFSTQVNPSVGLLHTFYVAMSVHLMSSCINPVVYFWRRREIRRPVLHLLNRHQESNLFLAGNEKH